MPLLDELISHFRGEAQRLAETPFAAEVVADLKSLEGIAAKRAQAAQAAFHLAETDVRDWLPPASTTSTSRRPPSPLSPLAASWPSSRSHQRHQAQPRADRARRLWRHGR